MNGWKVCSTCGAAISPAEWANLKFVGFQLADEGGALELRNHDCGSTLSVHVDPHHVPLPLRRELARLFRREARAIEPYARSEAIRLNEIADALGPEDETKTVPPGPRRERA